MPLTMPWGKYSGRRIAEVPSTYLVWCLEESSIEEPHRTGIRAELVWRLDLRLPSPPPALLLPPGELGPAFKAMLEAGYKTLALRLHPDKGGSTEIMQKVNATRDWCRDQGLL